MNTISLAPRKAGHFPVLSGSVALADGEMDVVSVETSRDHREVRTINKEKIKREKRRRKNKSKIVGREERVATIWFLNDGDKKEDDEEEG